MEALQNRIDSFSKSKRIKKSAKSSATILKWPHPRTFRANPEALAEAGFFYDPSAEDRDNVTCFECGKQLSEWEETDDPFDIHWEKCGDSCHWAVVRCGLRGDMDRHGRFTFPDKTRLPRSKRMEKARLGTYAVGDGWAHDQTKNHGANSRKMAEAGFVWTPQSPGDDLATCLYCHISLSGWDKDDDPLEEHQKRASKSGVICPFFTPSTGGKAQTPSAVSTSSSATATSATHKLTRSASQKPPSKTKSKVPARAPSSSRLVKNHKDTLQLTKEHDGSGDDDAGSGEGGEGSQSAPSIDKAAKATSTATKPKKSSRATSARPSTRGHTRASSQVTTKNPRASTRSRSQSRDTLGPAKHKTLKGVEEEDETVEEVDENESDMVQPVSQTITEEEDEEEQPAPSRTRTSNKPARKTRSKSVLASSKKKEEKMAENDNEEEENVEIKPKKVVRSKSKVRVVESDSPDEDEKPRKVVRSTSKSSGRGRAAKVAEDEDEEQNGVVAGTSTTLQKPSRSKSRSTLIPDKTAAPVDDGTEEAESSTKTKHMRTKSKARPAEDSSRVDSTVEVRPPSTARGKPVGRQPSVKATKVKSTKKTIVISTDDEDNEEIPEEILTVKLVASGRTALPPATSTLDQNTNPLENDDEAQWGLDEDPSNHVVEAHEDNNLPPISTYHTPASSVSDEPVEPPTKAEPLEQQAELPPLYIPKRGAKPAQPRKPISSTPTPFNVPGKQEKTAVETTEHSAEEEEAAEPISNKGLETSAVKSTARPAKKQEAYVQIITQKQKPKKVQTLQSSADDPLMHDGIIQEGAHSETALNALNDVQAWQVEDDANQKRKTSIHGKTPPPNELFELNFAATPMPVENEPVTPVRPGPMVPVVVEAPPSPTNAALVPEPPSSESTALPALSRIPFTPLQTLTDAELDMTVEDWIRYQMEVEYDKLKRDGERELGRFKVRAEEVRKMIESL
ncbi:hypothetical protein AX17_002200 [Amanita inopinata Kibby_2008]|nr:hypothetical protein AX17_002200 [Amanita inopinata Kibby_2008]